MTKKSSPRGHGGPPPPSAPADHTRRLMVGMGLWAFLFLVAAWAERPPNPRPLDAPANHFSAERAAATMDRLVDGLDGPHAAGTDAAGELAKRIEQELHGLDGFIVDVQEEIGVGPFGDVGRMRNVVARKRGRKGEKAIVLAAHYDSVGAGPGISDDLAGVAAILETARALGRIQLHRPVILLFTDGEEQGLVGADAFAHSHKWADEVEVVLNLEARGVTGPSHMFQTGANNGWLISNFADKSMRPDASSVSVEVYRRLPNETDFTVFQEKGWTGMNWAFIGDLFAYHTPFDDRAHLDLSSLQHQGQQMLAAVRGFQQIDADFEEGDAVYATLFGRLIARTSIPVTRLIALVGALGLLLGLQRLVKSGALGWGRATFGLVWVTLGIALPAVLATGFAAGSTALAGMPNPWHATASPSWIALAGILIVSVTFTASLGAKLVTPEGLSLMTWVQWGLLGLFTAVFVPGASHLFAWPAFWIALCSLGVRLNTARAGRMSRIAMFSLVVALPLWVPVATGLAEAFGLGAAGIVAVVLAFPLSLLVPLLAAAPAGPRRAIGGIGVALLLFGAVMVQVLPHRSSERPARMNLVYASDQNSDLWQVWTFGEELPEELSSALPWRPGRRGASWPGGDCYTARAEQLAYPLPVFDVEKIERVEGSGEIYLRARVRSYAYAAHTSVGIVSGHEVITQSVEGRVVPTERLRLIAPGSEGLQVEWVFEPGRAPLEIELTDRVHGLPPEGGFLNDARGRRHVPSHDGDGISLRAVHEVELPDPPQR